MNDYSCGFHTAQASTTGGSEFEIEREVSRPQTARNSSGIEREQPNAASSRHAQWAAADKQGRVPNVWVDDPRLTPDALAILQFMAVHPGWKLKRSYMVRSRPRGGPGWSPPRYIAARALLIGLGLIDPETRKLVLPADLTKGWTPVLRGEARDALFAGPRGTKATAAALYTRRFKTAPSRAEIMIRFGVSKDTLKRIGRGAKSNTHEAQNLTGGGVQNLTPAPAQNLTPTLYEDSTFNEDGQEREINNSQLQQSLSREAEADFCRSVSGASLERLTTRETLDLIGWAWRELVDVMPSDGSVEEPAMQAAVMVAMATDENREFQALVERLRAVRWHRVDPVKSAGYARKVIEDQIGTTMTVMSADVSAVIRAYDAQRALSPVPACPPLTLSQQFVTGEADVAACTTPEALANIAADRDRIVYEFEYVDGTPADVMDERKNEAAGAAAVAALTGCDNLVVDLCRANVNAMISIIGYAIGIAKVHMGADAKVRPEHVATVVRALNEWERAKEAVDPAATCEDTQALAEVDLNLDNGDEIISDPLAEPDTDMVASPWVRLMLSRNAAALSKTFRALKRAGLHERLSAHMALSAVKAGVSLTKSGRSLARLRSNERAVWAKARNTHPGLTRLDVTEYDLSIAIERLAGAEQGDTR